MSEVRFVKKIGAGHLGLNKKTLRTLAEDADGQVVPIYKVYGLAIKTRKGVSNENGEWISFMGQFEAIIFETGEIVRSGELFLPTLVTPMLESQIVSAKAGVIDNIDHDDEEAPKEAVFKGIQFAFEIGIEESDKSSTGYEFTSKNLMPEAENDLLTHMREQFSGEKDPKVLEQA